MVSGDPRRRNAPKKRPVKIQAEPMDLDQYEENQKAEAEDHLYRFIQGGITFTLPPFGTLDRSLMETADDDVDFMTAALKLGFETVMEDDAFEKWDALPLSLDGLNRLFKDWGDHSGMDTGK
jgi:hypothetical protein